jgi:hypothetical protein
LPDQPALVQSIKTALADFPADTANRYAALYWATAQYLNNTQIGIDDVRSGTETAKNTLKMTSSEAFKDIVEEQLKAFEEGEIDRQAYAAAFLKLSAACDAAGSK